MNAIPYSLAESDRARVARRSLELIGIKVADTAAKTVGACPECWRFGKAVPHRTPCPVCAERSERRAGK